MADDNSQMADGAVADQSNPVVLSMETFRELALAQERAAAQVTLDRLANQFPVVAALIDERDALLAKMADNPAADANSAPADSPTISARKGRR